MITGRSAIVTSILAVISEAPTGPLTREPISFMGHAIKLSVAEKITATVTLPSYAIEIDRRCELLDWETD
jgi:hypothetical protein